ncbi:glycosyltransferase family 4 protein [Joostella atrarenae]|uniref:Glycosyltransferase family 4 protein n=1 Tax=Joostella atrarenae TaxID=679257 RepID=A0ABS9J189_9FLAO|nr:glycosyltransferase family 4 protein [Joostella atrarenae]MCF8714149.1 glycosyltransferase family 4 protein [Joostella atrarenae]
MKKILIICYYWPPAGGPGVQRWLNFVKYLPEFGVEPIVFVPKNPDYPMEDASFLSKVPKDIKIIKQPIFEPYKLAAFLSSKKAKQISKGIITTKKQTFSEKFLLWIRGNFFIPDARIFWVKPSVSYLKDYIKKEKIETVITTGPPHSVHLIGMNLKEQLDFKWIADFRDPWTNIGYHSELKLSKRASQKHKELEAKVLNRADHVVTTSFTTKEEFEAITKKPIEVITNGFVTNKVAVKSLDNKFTISHIGSLLSGRNPENLWGVIEELLTENIGFKEDFNLQLAGVISDDVLASIKEHVPSENLSVLGYVSHNDAIKLQRSAQVLLLIEIDAKKTRGIIPGKLFEYFAAERPILALGPEKWDVEQLLNKTNAGLYFNYGDRDKLKTAILSLYKAYKNDNLYVNSVGIDKYHRKSLTEQLAGII